MRKIPYEYVILLLLEAVITFFLLVLSNYYLMTESTNFLNNQMYSQNVLGMRIASDSKDKNETDFRAIYESIGEKDMLYKNISDRNDIKRAVYFTNDIFNYTSYIGEGRFFKKEDFNADIPVAVIGFSIAENTVNIDGKEYIGIDDDLYQVIGVFKKTGEDMDDAVYINLNYYLTTDSPEGYYYIDSTEKSNVQKLLNKMKNILSTTYSVQIVPFEKARDDLHPTHKMIYALAIIAAVCNLINAAHFFVVRQKYKIAVKKLCGLTSKYMIFAYCRQILCITALGFIIGIAFIRLNQVISYFTLNHLGMNNYLIVLLLLLLTGTCIFFELTCESKKVDVSFDIK